jgi:hypothetical protein
VDTRPSDIAGQGWFAGADLPAGTVVLSAAADTIDIDALGPRFPNHSCDPNLGWTDGQTLVTMGDVAADTELVADYAMCVADPDWFLRCHCPSYRCRQMVEGRDWQIPQLQRRYAGWWAPHVQRLVDTAAG